MKTVDAIPLLLAVATASPVHKRDTSSCFPYGSVKLPTDMSTPSTSLQDWWCPQSLAYGFQGFSYPLEDSDCSNSDNSFEQMDQDFAQMSKDFGARVVRLYHPECTEASVFENALRAAVKNNIALIFQVWTNFGDGDTWKQSQQAIYDTLSCSQYGSLAPYVVHSADWGSEPVGDGMDNVSSDPSQFIHDLGSLRSQMNQHSIQAGISEDWDRPGSMTSSSNNAALGPVGQGVQQNSDYAHIHPMPYYHFNNPVSDAWGYIQQETLRVKNMTNLPVTITETQWAWGYSDHNPGKSDVGVDQYNTFWKTIDGNCQFFKENNVGWFLHAWKGEGTLSTVRDDGSLCYSGLEAAEVLMALWVEV